MSVKQSIQILKEKFGAKILDAVLEPTPTTKESAGVKDPFIRIAPEDLVEIMTFCRDDPRLRYDLLSCLTAIDYPKEQKIQLVYNLDSIPQNHWLTVKVDLPRENPRCPTLERVWPTADWHERETYDLMGVIFEGHHNLARILCAEDWEGHPLRKDYVMPEYYHGVPNAYEMFYDVQNP
jgi:NADH-quinone oxidoreductase subunit C